MKLSSILNVERTHSGVLANSKKKILQLSAELVCNDKPQFEPDILFDSLLTREKLGSTGIGYGVAIPHCRTPDCDSVTGSLMQLAEPIGFDAIDEQPVDLIFTLVVPQKATDEHLQILAGLAERFENADFRRQLRAASDNASLYRAAISLD